jgi:RNA polymerase sigma-70 factor (ECF subfamily)
LHKAAGYSGGFRVADVLFSNIESIMNCNVPELWLEHKEALYFYLLKRVQDEELAKDLCQDVLLKVYSFCMSKAGIRNVRSWLFQLAHNTMIDHFRKEGKMPRTDLDFAPDLQDAAAQSAMKEAAEFVLPMINLLPAMYADPLRMSDVEGRKLQEIADQLGLGLSAVKQRVSRARTMLRDIFTECCLLELDEQGRLAQFEIRPDCRSLQAYKASLKK